MKQHAKKRVASHLKFGLRCPKCGGKTEVKETRAGDGVILRRRNCTQCGHRKTARETWI